jgi:hypothetical protein
VPIYEASEIEVHVMYLDPVVIDKKFALVNGVVQVESVN